VLGIAGPQVADRMDPANDEAGQRNDRKWDVEVEDLRYGELKGVMKSYKALLLRSIKEKRAIQTHSVSRYPPK
jgi:hypothetical protein